MPEIRNKILRMVLVDWRAVEWFQGDLKEINPEAMAKLKASLVSNSFVQPFNVWEHSGKVSCLDGHHRKLAMEELLREGHKIPAKLPANFIDCADEREAKKLVLIYSAIYATARMDTLADFMAGAGIDLATLTAEMSLPDLDMDAFRVLYVDDPKEKRYGEDAAAGVKVHKCPQCGHEHVVQKGRKA